MASAEQPVLSRWSERALPRHSYPLWVVVAAAITFVAAIYSFMQLQTLVDAAGNLRAGERALAAHDYTTAAVQLEAAHEQAPASRKITIYLATADFGLGDQQAALALISGMKFSLHEWSTLTRTMPPSIQAHYHLTK
jgi:hypothetical protein